MSYILDQNMTRDNAINDFLKDGNEIILINDFIVEPFKSPNYQIILEKNLEILRRYPEKIFITFERGILVQKEWNKGYPIENDDIIDFESSKIFMNYLKNKIQYGSILKQNAEKRIKEHEDFVEIFIKKALEQYSKELKNLRYVYKSDKEKKINDIKELVLKLLGDILNEKCSTNYNIRLFEKKHFNEFLSIIYSCLENNRLEYKKWRSKFK
jgi:hypothetical protein